MKRFLFLFLIIFFGLNGFATLILDENADSEPINGNAGFGKTTWIAQSFIVDLNTTAVNIQAPIAHFNGLGKQVVIILYDDNGGGFPRNPLNCFDNNASMFPQHPSTTYFDFNINVTINCNLTKDTNYFIVAVSSTGDQTNNYLWYYSNTDIYSKGVAFETQNSGTSWARLAGADRLFRLWTDTNDFDASFNSRKIRDLNSFKSVADRNAIYDFNNTSNFGLKVFQDFNWFVDGVKRKTGTSLSDINFHYEGFNLESDYNISLILKVTDGNVSQQDLNLLVADVGNIPLNIDINANVLSYSTTNVDINFSVSFTDANINYIVWGGFQDGNNVGQRVNEDFNVNGKYNVCVTLQSIGDSNAVYCENFVLSDILVKRPLDETSSVILTPFSISTSQPVQSYTGLSADTNIFNFFQGNVNWTVSIDFNSDYYGRSYFFSLDDSPTFQILQPYLASVTTSALVTITLLDGLTNNPLPDYRVDMFKDINAGGTLFESKVTDGSGVVIFSLVIGSDYNALLYSPTNVFIDSKSISPSSTSYIWTISPISRDINVTDYPVTVDFLPSSLVLTVLAGGSTNVIFAENIQTGGSMISSNVHIMINDLNVLSDQNFVVDGNKTQDLNLANVANNSSIEVIVTVTNAFRTQVFHRIYIVKTTNDFDLITVAKAAKSDLSDVGAFFLALFLSICLTGFISYFIGFDSTVMGFFMAISLGVFVFVEWFPITIYLLGLLGFVVSTGLRGYFR